MFDHLKLVENMTGILVFSSLLLQIVLGTNLEISQKYRLAINAKDRQDFRI